MKLTEPSILCIQVFGTEFCKPLRQVPRPEGDGQSPPGAKKSLDNTAVAPPGIPVPVAPGNRPVGSTAKVGAGQAALFLLLPLPAGRSGRGKARPNVQKLFESWSELIQSLTSSAPRCLPMGAALQTLVTAPPRDLLVR